MGVANLRYLPAHPINHFGEAIARPMTRDETNRGHEALKSDLILRLQGGLRPEQGHLRHLRCRGGGGGGGGGDR